MVFKKDFCEDEDVRLDGSVEYLGIDEKNPSAQIGRRKAKDVRLVQLEDLQNRETRRWLEWA